ncbi:hypothetical protein C491_07656 [Natronococcus amylolyticus DSM 10524]|uniref:Uncharacterized protein n=1 Tax=Natronococcus amylolyticus DSM 10524 TaxID=1227497 RepID=L9XBT1_9EURY|nr:hypothetical protein [Natronococcus amylolyticus]ELY59199.1 hypothetical protein C491_07656 [Natronococcus amylolyticus DSM 10524]
MDRGTPAPPWPRWFRFLCYGLVAVIVLGMTYRTLEGATSTRAALQGVGGIAVLCLLLGYLYVSKTRWRDRNALSGLALLACLAITVGILAAFAPDSQWLDRELVVGFGAGALLALALILSRFISLSGRVFGVVVSAVGIGIIGLYTAGHWEATGRRNPFVAGAICLLVGLLYVIKPDAMAELERQARDREAD